MRKLFVLPLMAAIALALTSGAAAVAPKNTNSLTYTQSTDVGKKKATVTLTGNNTYGPAGSNQVPDIGFHTTIGLPIVNSSKGLYTCSKDEVDEYLSSTAAGRAPKKQCNKAVVGSGSATAYPVACGTHPPQSSVTPVMLTITLYADVNGLAAHLTAPPTGGLSISGSFEISIEKSANASVFAFGLPQSLLEPVGGLCSPITTFSLNINKTPARTKKRGKKPVFLRTGACKTSPVSATYHNDYTDGSLKPDGTLTDTMIDSADSTFSVTCKKR